LLSSGLPYTEDAHGTFPFGQSLLKKMLGEAYRRTVPRRVAQKIIFSSFLSWSRSFARLRIWRGIVTRMRSIGMLKPTHTAGC